VAYATGARRAELVGLDLADVTREEGALKVVIRGKGKKTRTTYMRAPLSDALLDWMQLRDAEPGPLFLRLQHGGLPMSDSRRLSTQAIYELLLARSVQAGIEHFSPHDLRRTCISNHLDAGTDITTVAGIVGHSNVQTTARYDRRGERAKRDAAGNLHIAYRRRDER
jgi:integrase